jgi:hypothetical protein
MRSGSVSASHSTSGAEARLAGEVERQVHAEAAVVGVG